MSPDNNTLAIGDFASNRVLYNGSGVATGDFDNDGLPDIFVTGYGGNALYRNRGNCSLKMSLTKPACVAAVL